ncbi:MAG: hypothetical protein KF795_15245 [Labilithrix sp.]|nr:hypothetical protein [Labilithrix sp.]
MKAFDSSLRAISITSLMFLVACGGDDTNGDPNTPGATPDGGSSTPPPASAPDAISEAVLAACPQSTSLIESTEWPSCVAGRRVTGTEPFNDSACELKIGQNGAFEYWRGGALALSVPERSGWGSATGTYQNTLSAGRRAFLASVAPNLPAVEGEPRVTDVNLNFFTLADDKVEIQYMDASLNRQTYTCQVNVL